MNMNNILIGTSGYDYPEWKGVFYPEDLKRKDFLSYYATQFNALELNNTFYSMPTAERLLSFYERSGGLLQHKSKPPANPRTWSQLAGRRHRFSCRPGTFGRKGQPLCHTFSISPGLSLHRRKQNLSGKINC